MKKNLCRSAFTLMEAIVSIGILAMFFTFLFKTFQQGSDSFNAGSWRIGKQKEAQTFMARLKEVLEKANYADKVGPDGDIGVRSQALPIYINSNFFNRVASVAGVNAPIMFLSICEPYIDAQPKLNLPQKLGTWTGVSLICQNRRLVLKRTGSWSEFNSPFAAPADEHPNPDGCFNDGRAGANFNVDITDVNDFGIFVTTATDTVDIATGTIIEARIGLSRLRNNQPTAATVNEMVKAKLLKNSHLIQTM